MQISVQTLLTSACKLPAGYFPVLAVHWQGGLWDERVLSPVSCLTNQFLSTKAFRLNLLICKIGDPTSN